MVIKHYCHVNCEAGFWVYAGTTTIALLDCQQTWFVADPEDLADPALSEDIDLVADYIEGYHEEPYRIRPSLYFLTVEAVQDGLMNRREADASEAVPAEPKRPTFGDLKDVADEPWEWPDNAGDLILGVLRDDRATMEERMLAAEWAGELTVIDDELIEALLAIIRSESEPVELRARAAISFGPTLETADEADFEERDSGAPITEGTFQMLQESLEALYRNDGIPAAVRRRILEAAVRAPLDWHREAVRTAWASGDPDWMHTAVFCMRFIPGFEGAISEALEDERPDLRYEAVQAAGNWGVEAAWGHIVPLITLDTEDKPLLIAAIEAAAHIRPSQVVYLLEGVANTEDEDILEAIEEALAVAEAAS